MIPNTPSDPPKSHISLHGHTVSYTDKGTGPVVVAIHGLPGDAGDFRWLGTALEPHVRLIRLELPGFGETSAKAGTLRWPDPPRFVAEMLQALSLTEVTLLGHSYGTGVALCTAAAYPNRIARLALLAPFGQHPHRGIRQFPAPGLVQFTLRLPLIRAPFIRALRRSLRDSGFRKPINDEQIIRTIDAIATWDFDAYRSAVASLACPVFGAYCKDDHLIEPHLMETILQDCPKGPRLVFDTGGHNLQKTYAVEVAAALSDWLLS